MLVVLQYQSFNGRVYVMESQFLWTSKSVDRYPQTRKSFINTEKIHTLNSGVLKTAEHCLPVFDSRVFIGRDVQGVWALFWVVQRLLVAVSAVILLFLGGDFVFQLMRWNHKRYHVISTFSLPLSANFSLPCSANFSLPYAADRFLCTQLQKNRWKNLLIACLKRIKTGSATNSHHTCHLTTV